MILFNYLLNNNLITSYRIKGIILRFFIYFLFGKEIFFKYKLSVFFRLIIN